MIRNKYILTPFLLLAWAVIFAHSVIPHHHHVHNSQNVCYHHHENKVVGNYSETHDCEGHTCLFQVDILSQISIDHIFIKSAELKLNQNPYLVCFTIYEKPYYLIKKEFYNPNLMRAPPVFIS